MKNFTESFQQGKTTQTLKILKSKRICRIIYAYWFVWATLCYFRWVWADGSAVDYLAWDKDQPNNVGGNEDCVDFNARTKKWSDTNCNRLKNFICQIK